jgi:hypothetical protein
MPAARFNVMPTRTGPVRVHVMPIHPGMLGLARGNSRYTNWALSSWAKRSLSSLPRHTDSLAELA